MKATYIKPEEVDYSTQETDKLFSELEEMLTKCIHVNHGAISAYSRVYDLYEYENKSEEWIQDLKRMWAIQDIIKVLKERM